MTDDKLLAIARKVAPCTVCSGRGSWDVSMSGDKPCRSCKGTAYDTKRLVIEALRSALQAEYERGKRDECETQVEGWEQKNQTQARELLELLEICGTREMKLASLTKSFGATAAAERERGRDEPRWVNVWYHDDLSYYLVGGVIVGGVNMLSGERPWWTSHKGDGGSSGPGPFATKAEAQEYVKQQVEQQTQSKGGK